MPKFEIWSEGFRATGDYGVATFHGVVWAETFEKACAFKFRGDKVYNAERNTYWGCHLFNNEKAARKTYG